MTLSQAQLEFKIRYYLWAGSEWEREISESLPALQGFKSGSFWKTHQFMRRLGRSDQLTVARALLKHFHPDAVKALGEECSLEEESLRFQCKELFRIRDLYRIVQNLETAGQPAEARAFFQRIRRDALTLAGETYFNDEKSLRSRLEKIFESLDLSFEEKLALREQSGEKVKFASKRKLQNAITEKFKQVFGNRCLNHDFDDVHDPSSQFDVKCSGWLLSTRFWFGRGGVAIHYNQSISSENMLVFQGPEGPYKARLGLASMISLSSWLGITSQIKWEYITPDEVDSTCDQVLKHVSHFFDVAPNLLKGLEAEKIRPE